MEALDFQLMAVSPIDGRYANRQGELPNIVSEFGLINARLEIMAGWMSMLGTGVLPDKQPLSDRAQEHLGEVVANFDLAGAREIKAIEDQKNHDVKAVEIWLTDRLTDGDFGEYRSMVHFGRTSEDVNSTAYGLMLKRAREVVLVPALRDIELDLIDKSVAWAAIPLAGMTHGQYATPTTLGKEMRVFADRLDDQTRGLDDVAIRAKFSGATGGYNADVFAYPEVDWPALCKRFVVERLDLEYAPTTTQIEPHDWVARYLNELNLANTVLADLAKDAWLYISRGVLSQKLKAGEVGSSTMPHKVNPIDFENAEGNFDIAGAIMQRLATSLPVSRMQRDLSDSTRLRAVGPALGHSLVGYSSLRKGLGKVFPNEEVLQAELKDNWGIITEAVQTIMRRYNIPDAYERVKAASRGQDLTQETYFALIEGQAELPEEAYLLLRALRPWTYLGYQEKIARGETRR